MFFHVGAFPDRKNVGLFLNTELVSGLGLINQQERGNGERLNAVSLPLFPFPTPLSLAALCGPGQEQQTLINTGVSSSPSN